MRKTIILAAVAALAFASTANAKRCQDPTTHKFIKCAAAAPDIKTQDHGIPWPKPAAATTATAGGAPHCVKGKPCGHSCIAMSKVCHKQ